MENAQENLTIGAFAKAARVNVETIRFYQLRACYPSRSGPTVASAATGRRTWRG